ncbi:MAG: hypothetical protein RL530_243 [Actinomycetota bacterium]
MLVQRALAATAVVSAMVFFPTAPSQAVIHLPEKCVVSTKVDNFSHCQTDSSGRFSVAIIGDSHARSWFEPMRLLAQKYSWKLTVISKSACPILDPEKFPKHLPSETCKSWNQQLQSYLATNPKFDLVVTASSSLVTHGYQSFATSFRAAVPSITGSGARLLVIRDNPKPASGFQRCIRENPRTAGAACARPRHEALTPKDPMPTAVRDMTNVKIADFTNSFCGPKLCQPVIGGIVVYKDHSHMSKAFARHLTPVLDAAIPAKFKG